MNKEMVERWCNHERSAFFRIGPECEPLGSSYQRMLHLSVYPSFSDATGFDLYISRSKYASVKWLLTKRCWHRSLDADRFETPVKWLSHVTQREPSIDQSMAEIETGVAERWTSGFSELSVPLKTDSRFGLDGTSYILVLGDAFTQIRFGWWCDGPEQWQKVAAHARSILADAEKIRDWKPWPEEVDNAVKVWAIWSANPPPLTEIRAARHLVPALRDRPLTAFIEESREAPRMYMTACSGGKAREMKRDAASLGLTLELEY